MIPNTVTETSVVLEQDRKRACAYTKLAYAVNATNNALRRKSIESQKFRKQYPDVKRLLNEKSESGDIDMWTVFNVLFQKRLYNPLTFASDGTASVAVDVKGKIFHVTLKKVGEQNNEYDVQLAKYYEVKEGKTTVLKLGEPFTDVLRIKKRRNLLIASDPETGVKIVKNQYIDRNYQAEAMLATVGMQMDAKGKILPLTVNEEPVPVNKAQLIVAGTGAGKGGIIATTAMMHGRGIFVTLPGKLVNDMVVEANSFIRSEDGRQIVEKFPDELPPKEVAAYLRDHPYTVMSHDQLVFYANVLQEQNIFIDEAHLIVPKVFKEDSEENVKKESLKGIVANNKVLGVTATPTIQLKELLGDPVYDLSLYKAQNEFKTVRAVSAEDTAVKSEKLAENAVKKLLTRSAKVQPTMRGWVRDPVKNTILSSQAQGFVFTDDPSTALEVHNLLSGLSLKSSSDLRATLNKEALRDRVGNKTKTKDKIDIYTEVATEQRNIIECNVKIDIIVTLGITKNTKKLQELVRNRKFDELNKIYTNAIEKQKKTGKVKDIVIALSKKIELISSENPVLKEYYDSVRKYFEFSMDQKLHHNAREKRLEFVIKKLHLGSSISELLIDQKDTAAEKAAAALQKKGLRMYVVSTGPLGTGHDDPNIRSTVVVEKHSVTKNLDIEGNPVIKRVQQCGRLIRANDGIAFGSSVTDEAIPEEERNLTFKEVYSKDATERYLNKTNIVDNYFLQNPDVKPILRNEEVMISDSDPEQIEDDPEIDKLESVLGSLKDEYESGEQNELLEDDSELNELLADDSELNTLLADKSDLEDRQAFESLREESDEKAMVDEKDELIVDASEEENEEAQTKNLTTPRHSLGLGTIEEDAEGEEEAIDDKYVRQVLASKTAVAEVENDVKKIIDSAQKFKEEVLANNEMSVRTLSYIGDNVIKMYESCEAKLTEVLNDHKDSLNNTRQHFQKEGISNSEFDSSLNQALKTIDSALGEVQSLSGASKDIDEQTRQEIRLQAEGMNQNTISLLGRTIDNLEKMQRSVAIYLQSNQGFFSRLWDKLFGGNKYQQVQYSQQKIATFLKEAKDQLGSKESKNSTASYTSIDKERYNAEKLEGEFKDLKNDIETKGVSLEDNEAEEDKQENPPKKLGY